MTRRGCGCCKSCKEESVLFNQDFYAPKSVRTLNSRTFTLTEKVYLRVREYNPETGKKISDNTDILYTNETPFSDEYMGGAGIGGDIFIGSGEVNGISYLDKSITSRDENGNRTKRTDYTSVLAVSGNHTSKAAIEYDLSDGHDFGVDNKYGYKRLAGTLLDITYFQSKVPAADRSNTPEIQLVSGYSAEDFGGFDRPHSVFVHTHTAGSGQSAQDGSGVNIYGFTSSESAPETKEEMLDLIESAGEAINTIDEVPEDILENGTEDRPNVTPGYQGKYDLELTRIEPDGPVEGKSFLILEAEDTFIRTGATIRSYFQPRVVTPVHTVFGQIESETTGRDYEEIYRDNLSTGDTLGSELDRVNVFNLRSVVGTLDDENWRRNGWKKIGSNHYECTKKIKPNTQVDFSELVPKDFFSFNTRDYGIEDRGNKLTVEFFDSKNDYVFSQTFERGTQLLSRDVESKETFTLAGVKFSKFGYDMDGTSQKYRGLINGNFDGAKYFTADNDYQETPFYLYGYKEGLASRYFWRGEVRFSGFDSGESLYQVSSGPEPGVYKVNGDGLFKYNNIDFFNNTLNKIDQDRIHNGIITPKIPVKDGGLVYFPEKYYRPTPTKVWDLDESTGFSVTDGLSFGNSEALGYGLNSSFSPSENWDQVDYVDDLARYYIKTEGSFGSGSVLSLSENANNSFLSFISVDFGGVYRRSLIGGSESRDQMSLPAGLQTVIRAALSSGKEVYLQADYYTWQQSNAWIKTPVRTRQSLDAINARRDISNEKLQEYLQDIEGSEQTVPIAWTQTLMSCYSSVMPTPSVYDNPYTHLTFRFRESHAEIGSLHEINLKTFDPSSGNRWRYKPSAWPEDYSFNGFTSLRFKIESDDCVPHKYSQIGTSDWESLPDHTESGHDNKYIQHQRCAQSECYYLAPYSTLNYKIDSIDFAGTSFELCEETGSSYSGCSATLVHSLSEHFANNYNDVGVVCSRYVSIERSSYQSSSANSINTGSTDQKASGGGTLYNMPIITNSLSHTETVSSAANSYGYDIEGYYIKELYTPTIHPSFVNAKLQDTEATVNFIFQTSCNPSDPRCVFENEITYTVDGNVGDLGSLNIIDVERGNNDSVTSENGASCNDYEVTKSITYVQSAFPPDRLQHNGAYFAAMNTSSYAEWSGTEQLGNKIGVELNLSVEVELEDPEGQVGPIESRKLTGDVNFYTLRLRSETDVNAFSYPEFISDKSSALVGVAPEGPSTPSSYSEQPSVSYCYAKQWPKERLIVSNSGESDFCLQAGGFFGQPDDVPLGLSIQEGEEYYSQYYTDLGHVTFDPPKKVLNPDGSEKTFGGDLVNGPIQVTGSPVSLASVGPTVSETLYSEDTSAINVDMFCTVVKHYWYEPLEFSVDLSEEFNPLEPEDLEIKLGDHLPEDNSSQLNPITAIYGPPMEEITENNISDCLKERFVGSEATSTVKDSIGLRESNGIGTIPVKDITINLTKREY